MKKLLISLLMLSCCIVYGQQLIFNASKVDTIIIESNVSAYQFDSNSTTKGIKYNFCFSYNNENDEYIVDRYFLNSYERLNKKDTTYNSFQNLLNGKKGVKRENVQKLLTALSESVGPNDLFKQIDLRAFKKHLSSKRVKAISKKLELGWYFDRLRFNKSFAEEVSSNDSIKLYLLDRFDDLSFSFVTDYSNSINIKIVTGKNKHIYFGNYPNPFKQPWFIPSERADFPKVMPSVLNFKINEVLVEILPKNYLLKESISIKWLVNDYLIWCIKRRGLSVE